MKKWFNIKKGPSESYTSFNSRFEDAYNASEFSGGSYIFSSQKINLGCKGSE